MGAAQHFSFTLAHHSRSLLVHMHEPPALPLPHVCLHPSAASLISANPHSSCLPTPAHHPVPSPPTRQAMRSLFGTLLASLPALWNVGALLALLFFMYAYTGVLLLGRVALNK